MQRSGTNSASSVESLLPVARMPLTFHVSRTSIWSIEITPRTMCGMLPANFGCPPSWSQPPITSQSACELPERNVAGPSNT